MGILYVVATPIGNLSDLSQRAVETLRAVDFIAAEDTRVSIKILNHLGIAKPQVSYFEHNKRAKGEEIAARILAGEDCALVTDAGTPAISDPGEDLVALCGEKGVEVVPVPGACAAVAALSVSGLPAGRWCFEGFLSTAKKNRREHLESLREERRTMIFYEAPHKLRATLADLCAAFGETRRVALCRELTKVHEEVRRTTLGEAAASFDTAAPKGEFVLVVEGAKVVPADYTAALSQALAKVREQMGHMTLKDAVKKVSAEEGVKKNALYQEALKIVEGETE